MLPNEVPAIEPCIPALPRVPIIAATSGSSFFNITISAAEYLMDSAKSVMDIFAESVALVNWSPINSEAPSPTILKVFITLVIKSAAPPLPPSSIPVALAT